MSKGNKRYFCILAILILFSLFAFGCKASRTPVERVDFDLTEIGGEEISLLVGDEYCPKITFVPSFASNKGFSFSSSNQEVLQISGQKIVAVSAGSAVLTVVAADNETIQNTILVRVYDAPIKLGGADVDAALNLRYNELDKKFTFNGIANAVGYTININGEDISLGQRLEFSLEEYAQHHQAFDCGLIAKVRADAPSYSHVAESSDFCAPITIYQVGEVQNVKIEADENGQSYLTFSHPHATNFDLSINGEKQPELTDLSSTKISLMALQNKYAGQMVNLQITALVNSEIAQMYSTAYPSVSRHYEINVLGPVQISLNASVLVWDSMPFAKGYNVFVGGEKVETVDDCSFNLNNLKTVEAGNTYEVYVEPVLSGLNLAKTGGHGNVIKFGKKPTPTLMVENDLLKWQSDQKEFLVEEFKNNELISSLALQANEYGLDEITDEEFEICVSELAETLEGVYYLTSQKASIKLSRLSAPELIYKKQENKFEINNQNNNQLVKEFVLSFAGSEQHFENDDLTRFSYDFKLGENEFGLTAISKGEVEGVHYLNSKPYKLLISKLAQPKSTSLNLNDFELETDANFFSYLTIETETLSESILNLTFDIQKENLKFKSENGMLKSVDEKNYSLPYLFDAGKFYISLLDDNYNLIISELKDAENLSFGLTAFVDGTSETEIASDETTTQFLLAPKSSAAGNEQNIEIQKSNLAAELTDYFVLINKNVLVNLSADNATIENEKIIVKLENLINTLKSHNINLTTEIELNVISSYENTVPTLGDVFKFKLADAPNVKLSKNLDSQANNAIEVSATQTETEYKKQYVFKVYNETKTVVEVVPFEDTNQIKFYLEDLANYYKFDGEIYLSAQILVVQQAEDFSTYVFNSLETEPIKISKLASVSNLKISNGILTFDDINANVACYEIYSVFSEQYTKLGSTKNTSFDLSNLDIAENFNLSVKVIANASAGNLPNCSNSNFSEQISARKTTLAISIDKGDFVLQCNQLSEMKTLFESTTDERAYVKINNLTSNKVFNFYADSVNKIDGTNFDFENNKITIEACLVLNYGVQIASEQLNFQIVVEYPTNQETYFVNSKLNNLIVQGLLKPTNLSVEYSLIENDEMVDCINWSNDNNPSSLSYNYILKVSYNGVTYSSLEGRFEANEKELKLDENRIKMPTKFISNLGDEVEFKEGSYLIEIKIYSLDAVEGKQYCSSAYAVAKIDILECPVLSVEGGNLTWERNELAQGYQLKIEDESKTIYLQTQNTYFNFDSTLMDEMSGILSVQIQAISKMKNETDVDILKSVANSKWSEKLTVYKLDKIKDVSVDDGILILNANKFFSTAEIEFVYDGNSVKYVLDNSTLASQQLSGLGIEDWDSLLDPSSLSETKKYIVDLKKADKFNNKINLSEGISYSVFVRLTGNDVNADTELKLPIVCSANAKALTTITPLKKADSKAIERGKLNFSTDTNLNVGELNYNFNELQAELTQVENLVAKIYKLELNIANEDYSIYALDYNYFVKKFGTLTEDKYKLYSEYNTLYGYLKLTTNDGEIYLNVFKDNIIDFTQEKIYYHKINLVVDEQNGQFKYSMLDSSLSEIDISAGGKFIVNVYLLAGDSAPEKAIANLTSPLMERVFVRYSINSIATLDGEVRFEDLTQVDAAGNPLDYPIYKLTATSVIGVKTFYLYYAQNNLQDVKLLVQDDDATFVEISDFKQMENTKFVWFEISKFLDNATSYNLTIQTLAGIGVNDNANYLLSAFRPSNRFNVYKYGLINSNVDKSMGRQLKFNALDGEYNIKQFELTLIDSATGKELVYRIDANSQNVKFATNYMYYTLPTKIEVDGEEIELSSSYQYKIRAIANNEEGQQGIINGSYNDLSNYTIKKAEEIGEFSIENGALKFATPKIAKRVYVKMAYAIDGLTKNLYFTLDINNSYDYQTYNFSDEAIYQDELSSITEAIVADRDYQINIIALGYDEGINYVLNGNFVVESKDVTRLPVVENLSAQDGVLTWGAVADATGYKVDVTGAEIKSFTTSNNYLDLSDELVSNTYSISVTALGSNKINSQACASKQFEKLQKVEHNSIELTDNTVSWNSVEKADKYYYEFEYYQNEEKVAVKNSTTAQNCTIPVGLSGQFTFKIQAQKLGNNNILNSQFETFESSILVPNAVEEFSWLENEYRFKIVTSSDFGANDSIEITSSVYKYNYDGKISLSEEMELLTTQIPYNAANNNVYYYEPAVMGQYSVISARVRRGSILSAGSMAKTDLTLQIFAAGDGNSVPYSINEIENGASVEQQLLNIKYRSSSKFVLRQSVELNCESISDFDGIIAKEFSGEFNGGGFEIKGFKAELANSNFSLFKKLNGAKIENVILGAANNSVSANYTSASSIYVAVLAQEAVNATIQKVQLREMSISVSGTSSGNVFVAGLICQTQNSKLLGCTAKLTINYSAISNAGIKYVAGLVAAANAGEFGSYENKTSVDLTLTSSNEVGATITYLGGIVGEYRSTESGLGKMDSVDAQINITSTTARNVGGLAGYSLCNDFNNCTASGKITTARLTSQSYVNLAGLVGVVQSSTLTNLKTNVGLEVNLAAGSEQNENIRVGILAGEISAGVQTRLSSISGCTSGVEFKNGKTTLGSTPLGVYGYLTDGAISDEISCEKA